MHSQKYKITNYITKSFSLSKKGRLQSLKYKILSLSYRTSAESKIKNPFLVIQGEGRVQNDGGQQDVEKEGGCEFREGVLCLIP
jgi:hypothetical protein